MASKRKFIYFLIAIWVAYGIWEYAVRHFSPEANIRVDLLFLYPLLGILSVYFIYKILKS